MIFHYLPSKFALMVAFVAMDASQVSAFSVMRSNPTTSIPSTTGRAWIRSMPIQATAASTSSPSSSSSFSDEVDRLRLKASELRAEVATLEENRANELASIVKKEFDRFDLNKDGVIDFKELQTGLEKFLKMDHVSQSQVDKLMKQFDTSGDGLLQLEEFSGINRLRNSLDMFEREEKQAMREAAQKTKEEETTAKLLQSAKDLINDRDATSTDKAFSILPYFFPLLDGLVFGRFLFMGHTDNPLVIGLGVLSALYQSIPLHGFLFFFALQILSDNLNLNRLVRFNMKQAIFLDVALFLPSVVSGLFTFLLSSQENNNLLGGIIPTAQLGEIASDAVFFILLASIGYSVVSSIGGVVPDKLPIISDSINKRMISSDMFDVKNGQLFIRQDDPLNDKKQKKDEENGK